MSPKSLEDKSKFNDTDIKKESKNRQSRRVVQGRRHVGMAGLHVDDVHLEVDTDSAGIKGRPRRPRPLADGAELVY
ncbi:hypothetical protein EYF80_015976 [Liparis tanakae]|uniref:Uncharacterized protein n=1 Tax=Liparis tanakae TaxID=230148 RepID=A0A4Z2I743_9TELE|nr:hypothetical protein EYF80_015976 [Liparis tanakae]